MTSTSSDQMSARQSARAKAPPQSNWAKHRKQITKLYVDEGKPLAKVMAVMSKQGFRPNEGHYKKQLGLWRLRKNERRSSKRIDPDDLLEDKQRAERWVRESKYFMATEQLGHMESLSRHLLLTLVSQEAVCSETC